MEAGMTQREVTKWYSLHLLKTLFVSETQLRWTQWGEYKATYYQWHKWNPRDEHFGWTGDRGGQMWSGHKTDKMIAVTGQGNNRVVYTNNKTVTILSSNFYLDFCLFHLKEKKNYCTELNLCIIRLFTSTLRWSRKKKGEEGKKFKSLKPDRTEKRELKNSLLHSTKTKNKTKPKNK